MYPLRSYSRTSTPIKFKYQTIHTYKYLQVYMYQPELEHLSLIVILHTQLCTEVLECATPGSQTPGHNSSYLVSCQEEQRMKINVYHVWESNPRPTGNTTFIHAHNFLIIVFFCSFILFYSMNIWSTSRYFLTDIAVFPFRAEVFLPMNIFLWLVVWFCFEWSLYHWMVRIIHRCIYLGWLNFIFNHLCRWQQRMVA